MSVRSRGYDYPLVVGFVVMAVVFTAAFLVAFRSIDHVVRDNRKAIAAVGRLADENCTRQERAWDNRRTAYLRMTDPVAPSRDPERRVIDAALNEQAARERAALLAVLGERPTCPRTDN